MPPTVVRSYSKINLGLRIGPPRADGFHHLTTMYQTVALHDLVTVQAVAAPATEITMSASDSRVPCDGRNTAWKMVTAALEGLGVAARVHIHLEKRLPPQGGMGAGSANAAAALLGLERQLKMALDGPARLRIAVQVGSDVPLFLIGGTVYGHNRGEVVLPYPDLPEMPCLIVAPAQGSSTPAAFRAWDEQITQLTPEAAHGRLDELSRVYASAFTPAGQESPGSLPDAFQAGSLGVSGALDGVVKATHEADGDLAGNAFLALVRTGIENDFEEVVFQQHPSLREIKRALLNENGRPEETYALCAMLSGSGSSIFGLFRTVADAKAAEQRVQVLRTGARLFVTRTVSRKRYWQEMFEE
ncbi:4-(cytidine 5'-diphospho)-2-C-methyl-D-erythritol kinase [Terriglobus sp.]|uniref:4-(cytidine 5'-diphospho)-2-C-methyl-D-erythritol kinase n=1 Tax=Terriglobus sp. TaxID=1889013 RepID=UPI003AFFEB5C